jgi:carboxypeptidase C (cathepsin A)
MARLVRATSRGTVPIRVARTGRAEGRARGGLGSGHGPVLCDLVDARLMHAIRLLAATALLGFLAMNAHGQGSPPGSAPATPPSQDSPRERSAERSAERGAERSAERGREAVRLPPDQTTHQSLELSGRTLRFAATAGSIRLSNDEAVPQAEVAFVAYQLEGADRRTRPVAFVFNGGPGMASGWLQAAAVGPWRVAIGDGAGVPSASPEPMPNNETWLDFTDLVFIDPPGTGFSTILAKGDEVRRRVWSVGGDIDTLAEVIRRWLDRNDRIVSPKYLVGESYGGFRGPRLARALQSDFGIGISGMVLLSPLLDTHVESGYNNPFGWVDALPSEVAAARALKGKVARADVADVEQYAVTGYLADIMRGVRDTEAASRLSDHVAALTGIDRAVVARYSGRLDGDVFLHELQRAQGRVNSIYDATVSETDPHPLRPLSEYPDPILEALKAPITGAMVAIYSGKLNWRPDGVYRLSNDEAFREWNWGRGMGRPESLSYLQSALALDPRLHVLIAHGLFDLRTPYFGTQRLLNQLPDAGTAERVKLVVYPGGHMFYSDDASRAAFHDAASGLFGGQ